MNDELYSVMEDVNDEEDELHENLDELISDCMPNLKPGIKLPNTDAQWTEADLFFRAELPISEISELSANECILKMTNTVYDYFAENFVTIKKSNVYSVYQKKGYPLKFKLVIIIVISLF